MRSKEIKNLNGLNSADANELTAWLEKNIGPENVGANNFGVYRCGDNWSLYRIWNTYYVEFDARKVKREQMTWFRLKWAK